MNDDALLALFGQRLEPVASVSLPTPQVNAPVPGPAHYAQFVAELVGPRSVAADLARRLMDSDWQGALGQPQAYAMRASDATWQPLTSSANGSYDSIALAWDMISDRGVMTRNSAEQLIQTLEGFAQVIQRKVMALPLPQDIAKVVKQLGLVQQNFDVGITRIVVPRRGYVLEKDLWIASASLGLDFSPSGSFDYRSALHPNPLFSVTPLGEVERFSLAAVQNQAQHEGVSIGFSLPRSPDPIVGFEMLLRACQHLAQAMDGIVADEEGNPVTPESEAKTLHALREPVRLLTKAGITPGSSAALRLFP